MQLPIQVTFHGVKHSAALDAAIREHAGKLDHFHPQVISCRAVVEEAARHQRQGRQFTVRLDIKVPGGEVAISRDHDEDPFVALRDAFDAARRQLEDQVRKQRGDVKSKASR